MGFVMVILLGGGCSDDEGTGGEDASAGDEGTGDGGASEDGDEGANMPTGGSSGDAADESAGGADDGGTEGVDAIVGEWVGGQMLVPGYSDHMTVRDDGTATAELYYDMDGGLWGVQLHATITVVDGDYAFAFRCEEPGDCTPYEFDTTCGLYGEMLSCVPAPDWYWRESIELERPD